MVSSNLPGLMSKPEFLREESRFTMLVGELKAQKTVNKADYCERLNTALVQNEIVTQIHRKSRDVIY